MNYKVPSQNPFGLYDFIGYFIPGFIFIFGISYIFKEKVHYVTYDVSALMCPGSKTISELVFLFSLIILSYVTGQIIGILSAGLLEKCFFVELCHYPSHYSLQDEPKISWLGKSENLLDKVFIFLLISIFFPIVFYFG